MSRRLLAAAVLVWALLLAAASPTASVSLSPAGSQDWWTPVAQLGGEGHLHVDYSAPIGQTVSGTIVLPFQFTEHHNLGQGRDFRIHSDGGAECYRRNVTVPTDADGNGTLHLDVTLDTTCFHDGLRSVVFSWRIQQADGNLQIVRGSFPMNVQNGGTDANWKPNYVLGGGWYKEASPKRDWGYIHALLFSAWPTAPLSGVWSPVIQYTRKPRDAGVANADSFATLDPDFHAGNQGTVLEHQLSMSPKHTLRVDTTLLSNGLHKLVLVSCAQIVAESKHHCGVLAIPFTVQN
jgi:hypothetical protein